MSKYEIPGCDKIAQIKEYDKGIYMNSDALPFGIVYDDVKTEKQNLENTNPFEYINEMYSHLYGGTCEIFKPITYTIEEESKSYKKIHVLNIPENSVVYCNMPSDSEMKASVNLNDSINQLYATWLSPSVMYVPCVESDAIIEISGNDISHFTDCQFYYYDVEEFHSIVNEIKNNGAGFKINRFENGRIEGTVNSKIDNAYLFLPIISSDGWKAVVNGNVVETEEFADSMISIPLQKGENQIVLRYCLPGKTQGVFLSLFGFILFVLIVIYGRKSIAYD